MNLNAFCSRFVTTDARICRSASIVDVLARPASPERRARVRIVAATDAVSMNSANQEGSRYARPPPGAPRRASVPISSVSPVRLRLSTAPVLPPLPTLPVLRMSNARIAVLIRLRSSCAKTPGVRSRVRLAPGPRFRTRPYSVTASAMASSRQRLSVRNSSVRDRRVQLDGQLGDGLADVAVVVDDLRHGEAPPQQVVPVLSRSC